ncbi:hypothetical protein [Microbacterium sp. No. 7]|uniref:hypothetical protein n=1 Tax=Microbacterium sp. No. 7 TaxID=1714373 RepID=UPI0006D02C65|nr:hypothetical protein [Microbacterium sp. No. 7]
MRRPVPLIAVAAASLLVLTACSGDSKAPSTDDWQNSPLNQYLSSAWGGDLSEEEQQRKFTEEQNKIQELVAACMTEEGFEYTPFDQSASISFGSSEEWNPESKEWVAQWGYGAVNWPGKTEMNEPVDESEMPVDPNQEYVESLSESEQTAYWEALHGKGPTEDELNEDGSYEWNWETAGCYGAAQHEVYGEQNVWEDEQFADLNEAMSQMWSDIENDPRIVELDAEWAACMADAGHSGFTKQFDAQQSIYDEMNKFWEEGGPQWDDSLTEEENAKIFEDFNKEIEKQMEPLAEKEVELALADLECREKTDYRGEQMKIQFAIEEQFIADHKTELEAFKAAAEQRG